MSATDASYPAPADSGTYEAGLTTVGEFDTVESYCRYFNWLKPPAKLERNSNYHLFKSGIKPMWEDEANANGGKWVLTMKNNPALLDQCWQWLTMALVGEELDEGDEICGAVVSLRSKVDRIQVWTRSKDDVEKVNGIGRKLVKLLDVSEADGIGLEFQVSSRLSAHHCSPPRIPILIFFLVQYGGSPAAKQVPFDTGRPSVVVPTHISQQRSSQPSHWSRRRARTWQHWPRRGIYGLRWRCAQWWWGQWMAHEARWRWCILGTRLGYVYISTLVSRRGVESSVSR